MQIKRCSDYYEEMQKLYPDLPIEDLRRIIRYGWNVYFAVVNRGADVCVSGRNGFWCYTGNFPKGSIAMFHYYRHKLARKIRITNERKKTKWDGYYYFGIPKSQYERLKASQKHRGRKKKFFTFENIKLYRYLDECKLEQNLCTHIYRIPYDIYLGVTVLKRQLRTDRAELIIERNPPKFKDILTSENEYDVL